MDKGKSYEVKDISLAELGKMKVEMAEMEMGALLKIRERFRKEKPFKGITIGLALHVTKETGVLVRTLVAGGAKVAITGCNPLSTQDDVAAALAKEGVHVWAYKGETTKDYYRYIGYVIDQKPNITIDDGCDLVSEIHSKRPELIPNIIGGCEETTTGIIRLKAMVRDNALKYPIIAVNDNKTKHLLDNYLGTGESTWDGIKRGTNVLVAGKTVVVAGYGSCGKGVALRAKGMGGKVIVTEVDPFRALQAFYDGYQVMPMDEAVRKGDIFITLTGNKHVIKTKHMEKMRDGAIVCNSGHFDIEIDYAGLKKISKSVKEVRPLVEEFTLRNGKRIIFLAQGRLVNLALAEGHPSTVMDTSFCGQSLACEYLVKNRGKLRPGVIELPESIDHEISLLKLATYGVKIDKMEPEQIKYVNSWQEGT
ncbi:MAG: adenosylhomocysteinase [Candidatus Aenigmatarchaeota archaeon]|nr:MAG: adenosylhomocysteinase [Candidatus Aenigmarchaeota archaeon]